MKVLAIILIIQLGIMLFAGYQAYKNKKGFWELLNVRAFWGIALLFHLVGIFLDIYTYKCALAGQYDLVYDEKGMQTVLFVMQVVLALIDLLTIYLMTKKHWEVQKMFRIFVYSSVLVLLVVFEILLASQFVRSFVVIFIEVNVVPFVLSGCVDLGRKLQQK